MLRRRRRLITTAAPSKIMSGTKRYSQSIIVSFRRRSQGCASQADLPRALFKTPCDREEEKCTGGIERVMVGGVRTAIVGVENLPVLEVGYEPLDRCAKG